MDLDELKVSRSLRRSCRRFEVRVDTAFHEVVEACGDPKRPHGWINQEIREAYGRLHELGWAHSVECFSIESGELVGGLYGVSIGGLFAGESMFHTEADASKVALVGLVELLRAENSGAPEAPARLLDVQWATEHLASLGVREIPRTDYLRRLRSALDASVPSAFL